MAIRKYPPNTIFLGGGPVGPGGMGGYALDNEHVALVEIIPGMLIETDNTTDNTSIGWKPHATSAGAVRQKAFALEQIYFTSDDPAVDHPYAVQDLVLAAYMYPGSTVWALIPSGATIVAGDDMESNGDGMLKKGSTNPVARAIESVNATDGDTRLQVEVL